MRYNQYLIITAKCNDYICDQCEEKLTITCDGCEKYIICLKCNGSYDEKELFIICDVCNNKLCDECEPVLPCCYKSQTKKRLDGNNDQVDNNNAYKQQHRLSIDNSSTESNVDDEEMVVVD